MVYFVLCIDVDRDAPYPMKGIPHAVSLPLQDIPGIMSVIPEKAAKIRGTMKGMSMLLPLLREKKIDPVLFHEARTLDMIRKSNPKLLKEIAKGSYQHGLHGVDHEDFSGNLTEIQLTRSIKESLLKRGIEIVEKCTGEKTTVFRAPYMEQDNEMTNLLLENGIFQDSSEYTESASAIYPRRKGELIEFPVIKTPHNEHFKGMYTYLWPFFEGKRSIEEIIAIYIKLAENEEEKENNLHLGDAYISINLHPWHLAYLIDEKRYLSTEEEKKQLRLLTMLFDEIIDCGYSFTTFNGLLGRI